MSRIFTKRRVLLGLATALVACVAAFAFSTTAGDGEGTGAADDGYAESVAISSALADNPNGLVPGGSSEFDVLIENPNVGSAEVTTLPADDMDAGGAAEGTGGPDGCLDSWFSIEDVDVDEVLAAADSTDGSGPDSTTVQATIAMEDAYTNATPPVPVDQNACKGAAIHIDWSSDDGTP